MKTTKTGASVKTFLDAIPDERKRVDAKALDKLIRTTTGAKPSMWGTSIIGYGDSTLRYANGTEVEWMALGFSPRATSLTLYLSDVAKLSSTLKKLGPHKIGKGCLYVKRLADVDLAVLEAIVKKSFEAGLA